MDERTAFREFVDAVTAVRDACDALMEGRGDVTALRASLDEAQRRLDAARRAFAALEASKR